MISKIENALILLHDFGIYMKLMLTVTQTVVNSNAATNTRIALWQSIKLLLACGNQSLHLIAPLTGRSKTKFLRPQSIRQLFKCQWLRLAEKAALQLL